MPIATSITEVDPILVAAAMLFEKQGYDETTIEEIAERAGVARQTVHAKFHDKPGVLAAIVTTFFASFAHYVLDW